MVDKKKFYQESEKVSSYNELQIAVERQSEYLAET